MKLNKLTIPVILTLVLGIGIVSCTGKTTQKNMHTGVEYYRNLQFSETPYDIEKGTHPLTADEAKTINNYKFTYDNSDVFYQWNLSGIMCFLVIHQWRVLQK